jgi:hypothetical protein
MKDLVYERMVDTREDLTRRPVDVATRISDFNSLHYTVYCETGIEAEGGHFYHFYSIETTGYIKSCATITRLLLLRCYIRIQMIVTFYTHSSVTLRIVPLLI